MRVIYAGISRRQNTVPGQLFHELPSSATNRGRLARFPEELSWYRIHFRSRSAFPITDTELKLIAAAAIIGESSRPNFG